MPVKRWRLPMARFTLILAVLSCSAAFAELDYKQLAASKRDQPGTVTTTENIVIPIPHGEIQIPKTSTVRFLAISPEGRLDIEYNGQKYGIPAAKTDLEKRVAAIRSRRIVVDGWEYEDIEFLDPTAGDVTIKHRAGAFKVLLSTLPPDLQRKIGYDPGKAAKWELAMRVQAEMEEARHTDFKDPLQVGMVGVSYRWTIKVLQVVGPQEMRAEVYTAYEEIVEDRTRMIHIGPPGSYIHPRERKWFSKPHDVWIRGVSTEGLVDGANMDYRNPLTVTGTKTYDTTAGAGRTVFVLEPFLPGRNLKKLESYRYQDGTFNSFPFVPETNRNTP